MPAAQYGGALYWIQPKILIAQPLGVGQKSSQKVILPL